MTSITAKTPIITKCYLPYRCAVGKISSKLMWTIIPAEKARRVYTKVVVRKRKRIV
jgi:hypothetical protein